MVGGLALGGWRRGLVRDYARDQRAIAVVPIACCAINKINATT
jgi:hypothetical protein